MLLRGKEPFLINESFFLHSGGGHKRSHPSESSATRQQIGFERRAMTLGQSLRRNGCVCRFPIAFSGGIIPVCTTSSCRYFEFLAALLGSILPLQLCIDNGVTADLASVVSTFRYCYFGGRHCKANTTALCF
jgi:hypothetical protein